MSEAPGRSRLDWLTPADPRPDTVRHVAELACRAPSIYNTQPWRWKTQGNSLLLSADRTRQLGVADPQGRELVLSCGAALDHARAAAAAVGLSADVTRFPTGHEPDRLATLELGTPAVPHRDPLLLEALRLRCTDRRRFTRWPVSGERVLELAGTVAPRRQATSGVEVIPLVDLWAKVRVEMLATLATTARNNDAAYQAERGKWGFGVAAGVAPPPVDDHVPSAADEVVLADGLIVLATPLDDAAAWLSVGEVLSELWLTATTGDLSIVPISQPLGLAATRELISDELLGGLVPQLILRLGWQPIGRFGLPHSPRRPFSEVIQT